MLDDLVGSGRRTLFKKSLKVGRFKWDQDEIWQDYSSKKYASSDGVNRITDITPYFQDGRH